MKTFFFDVGDGVDVCHESLVEGSNVIEALLRVPWGAKYLLCIILWDQTYLHICNVQLC